MCCVCVCVVSVLSGEMGCCDFVCLKCLWCVGCVVKDVVEGIDVWNV